MESKMTSWRKVPYKWDIEFRDALVQEVGGWRPLEGLGLDSVNALLVGQVGNGKSSFINTIHSVFRGYVSPKVVTGSADHSLTTKFRKVPLHQGRRGDRLHFRLCDTMGLEEGQDFESLGFGYLLDGNIPDNFQFNPRTAVTMETLGIINQPQTREKTHVLVMVIDGCTVGVMPQVLLDRLKVMKRLANTKGVPVMALMTKLDKLHNNMLTKLESTYENAQVGDAMAKLSEKLEIPKSQIMPVKNYSDEVELDEKIDILALTAMRQILRLADVYCEEQLDRLEASMPKKETKQDVMGDNKKLFNTSKASSLYEKEAAGKSAIRTLRYNVMWHASWGESLQTALNDFLQQTEEVLLAQYNVRAKRLPNCSTPSQVAKDCLTIVPCLKQSRLGTNIETTLSTLQIRLAQIDISQYVLVVFHHELKGFVLTTSSLELANSICSRFHSVVDCMFWDSVGFYSCPENSQAIKILAIELSDFGI